MMKKIKILSLLVCLIALFTACHDEEDKTNGNYIQSYSLKPLKSYKFSN